MTDMTAFERQVAGEMVGRAGPIRPVNDLAVFESVIAATRSPRWGFSMFSALKFVTAGVIVALFGGFLLTGVLTTQQGDDMAPAAMTESPAPMPEGPTVAVVTRIEGSVVEDHNVERSLRTFVNDALLRYGSKFETTYRWSDPRLPASGWSIRNLVYYVNPYEDEGRWGGSVWSGTMGLDGPDGSWVGRMTGMQYTDGSAVTHAKLTGERAYDGLTAFLDIRGTMPIVSSSEDDADQGDDEIDGPMLDGVVEGLIIKGDGPVAWPSD